MRSWDITNVVAASRLNVSMDLKMVSKMFVSTEMSKYMPCVVWRHKKIKGTALLFSSGYISVHGKMSILQIKKSLRQFVRLLQKKGFHPEMYSIRIVTISGVFRLPEGNVDLFGLARKLKCQYEPELYPALIIAKPLFKALIYASGVIVLTGIKHTSKSFMHVGETLSLIAKYIRQMKHASVRHI